MEHGPVGGASVCGQLLECVTVEGCRLEPPCRGERGKEARPYRSLSGQKQKAENE